MARALKLLLGVLAAALWAGPSGAAERVVEMYDLVFIPTAFSVEVGDAVTWVWREGSHHITSGLSSDDPDAGGLFDAPIDAQHPSYTYVFEAAGNFAFFDRLNEAASFVGSITVVPYQVEVEVVDLAFTPEEVFIFEGDGLQWTWIEGSHTITSGSGSADPQVGRLFDAPSNQGSPLYTYAFNSAGDYSYFCRPHEEMGMRGKVVVQRRFVRGDLTGDGTLDISDAVLTLGVLFLGTPARDCLDAADTNDDGTVDVSDAVFVLEHLFLGGRDIPPPFPRPGPDRTEDNLQCR
jgi:plastocyanin